jgi:hypothetical protein
MMGGFHAHDHPAGATDSGTGASDISDSKFGTFPFYWNDRWEFKVNAKPAKEVLGDMSGIMHSKGEYSDFLLGSANLLSPWMLAQTCMGAQICPGHFPPDFVDNSGRI